jgi:tetratricopeptide (TPR) repeat protein
MVAGALRRLLLALLVVAGVCTGGDLSALVQSQSIQDTPMAKRVREWLALVEAHGPGQFDEPLKTVYFWPDDRLRVLEQDLTRVLRARTPPIEASLLQLDVPDVRARILRRAAMLHTDAALLASLDTSSGASGSMTRRSVGGGLLLNDGLGAGFAASPFHWLLARLLLDALPAAASDSFVDLWYRATTAALLALKDYATADAQLEHAQTLLPTRTHVWLSAGVMHAHYASSSVQNAFVDLKLPEGFHLKVGDERRELELADECLRRAIALEPDNVEARLRLGRVLALQQKYTNALAELHQAAVGAQEPIQLYFVHLFTGQVQAELQQYEPARISFTRAAGLFPDAQAPVLALSELAWRRGDRAEALAALRRVSPKPSGEGGPMDADPWWTYDASYARDAAQLVAQLRKQFALEGR